MRISIALISAIAGVATAVAPGVLQRRQVTQNDLKSGTCKKVSLIFARASTELGNMGESMGPTVCSGLKSKLGAGSVACQGVGGAYTAGLADNVSKTGTSAAAIAEAKSMFSLANSKCPQTIIVAGGYSQGTAVMMNAISTLEEGIRAKIVGVVLFGYTKNGQTKGTIPNFPTENLKVFCTKGDGVCWGQLNVSAGHFAYMGNGDGPAATKFLLEKIAAGPGKSSSGGAETSEAAPAASPTKGKGAAKGKGKGNLIDEVNSLRMTRGMMRVRRLR